MSYSGFKSLLGGGKRPLIVRTEGLLRNSAFNFYLISLVAIVVPLSVLYYRVNCPIFAGIIFALSDASIVLLPYWFIKRRRWLTLMPVWVTVLFVEINLLMLSWGGELITFHSIYMTGNVDDAVTSNIPDLIGFINVFIIILAILYTTYFFVFKRRISNGVLNKRLIKVGVIVSVVLFVIVQAALQLRWQRDTQVSLGSIKLTERIVGHHNIRTRDFIYKGYPIYVITNIAEMFKSRELSDSEIRRVEDFLLSIETPITHDSVFIGNREKNLIIVVVESLNSHAVTAVVNGKEIMPNLKSLIGQEGAISNLNIVTQIKDGSSGDGQLIINTGLLPIKNGSANLEYGSTTEFVSFPALTPNHHPVVVVAEKGNTWAQRPTFLSFGFKEIHTSMEYAGKNHVTDDEMFEEAQRVVKEQELPFLMEIVTFTMHAPFDMVPVEIPDWIEDSNLDPVKKRYYNAANFMDVSLGEFLASLKETGLWDSSVIVIVADHSIPTDEAGESRRNPNIPTPFIAVNTGATMNLDKPAGQVDIFPTIAEIMGVENELGRIIVGRRVVAWRGLGKSMLSDEVTGSVDVWGNTHGEVDSNNANHLKEAFEVSDMIIRGNYFKQTLLRD